MNQQAEQIYNEMMQELERIRLTETNVQSMLEKSFDTSIGYWEKVRRMVEEYEFVNEEEEIKFFKVIKPQFLSEREFYSLRYHSQLFINDTNDQRDLNKFWSKEIMRLEKFISEHFIFYDYYKDGLTVNDGRWFTRKLMDPTTSTHDGLVSTLKALERYMQFGLQQLKLVNQR